MFFFSFSKELSPSFLIASVWVLSCLDQQMERAWNKGLTLLVWTSALNHVQFSVQIFFSICRTGWKVGSLGHLPTSKLHDPASVIAGIAIFFCGEKASDVTCLSCFRCSSWLWMRRYHRDCRAIRNKIELVGNIGRGLSAYSCEKWKVWVEKISTDNYFIIPITETFGTWTKAVNINFWIEGIMRCNPL